MIALILVLASIALALGSIAGLATMGAGRIRRDANLENRS